MNEKTTNGESEFPGPMDILWHGAAYYPELWPMQSPREELERVRDAGLSVVRIGEFAWSKMEPLEGEFDFSLFEEVMDIALELGLAVVLGTPTATPPIWLTHGHADRTLHDQEGRVMSHGGRQHAAIEHPYVRERCRIIVTEMAKALGAHPALIAWQIDNEFKCDVSEDYGPSVRPVWEEWLKERYETIENLNTAWGTGVWSQEYQDFEQVPFPVKCPGLHNASLLTAWKRFHRERIAGYGAEQAEIVRQFSKAPITHNAGMLFQSNPELVMESMDFVSFDHYVDSDNWYRMVTNYDYWRNLKPDRSFWLMETSSAHNGSLLGFHKPHPKGFVKAEAVAAYALGAKAFCYWVWRQQRAGAELTHGCLMQSWDSPTVGMQACREVEAARQILEPALSGKRVKRAEVALMWSDTGRVMLDTEPHNGLDYCELLTQWSRVLRSTGMHVDVVPEGDSLEGRRVLITPFMPAVSEEMLGRIEAFVRAGGTWIAGPLTGGRTIEHTVPVDRGLGCVEAIAGIRVKHSYPLFNSGAEGVAFDARVELTGWSYLLESEGAKMVGTIEGGPTPGLGFLSENALGEGKVVVLGSEPCGERHDEFLKALFSHYAQGAAVEQWFTVSEGSFVSPWESLDSESSETLIACNFDGEGGSLRLPGRCIDTETGVEIDSEELVSIPAYGFRILAVEPKAYFRRDEEGTAVLVDRV
ncbi:beta-galactosidase [Pelagicoccus mobilis]|uniref:Beta-galactosidase n=1 Tax=Pelagicoccus mobilis TaxID=415221 RepID=A0A934RZ04_9BACT|nr:beta-galactosidase [Pelagicoccus mobilis]MBK1876108.1 beta-galactosidase [Pelagicoccus mobilis]